MGLRGKSGKRLVLATLGVVGALVFAGCDWPMMGYDAANTGSSPDTGINGSNVSTLQRLFAYNDSTALGMPVESNGVVYVADGNGTSGSLEAFDANGVTNCSGTPNQCSPLWTASIATVPFNSAPAVANGVVYVGSTGTLYAFDANGVTNCSGTPKVCQPLWTAPAQGSSSVAVVNGVAYIGSLFSTTGGVEAIDANGVTNCSGTPKVCQPLWTSSVKIGFSSPAVANGVVYATGSDQKLYAFSADGTTGCSGTPTTCNPLWTSVAVARGPGGGPWVGSPTVANGVVYFQDSANLYALDANGVTNCSGTPTTCSPLWTGTGAFASGFGGSPAVANGVVYAPTNAQLLAYDANGVTNCSGTPKTCQPEWFYNTNGAFTPAIADGLVFVGEINVTGPVGPGFAAFDAGGGTNCTGTPKVCNSVWTDPTAGGEIEGPAIANGKVYATQNPLFGGAGQLDAWSLAPAGKTFQTTTSLSPSLPPVRLSLGQQAAYSATVLPSPPPGGTVAFTENGSPIAGCSAVPITGASAGCTWTPSAGVYNIVATYAGMGAFSGSSSPSAPLIVEGPPPQLPCTQLASCNLSGFNLSATDFSGADLKEANLQGANLAGADFSGANLQGANLQGANLSLAELYLANLKGANLKDVTWSNTGCPDGTSSDEDGGTCAGNL